MTMKRITATIAAFAFLVLASGSIHAAEGEAHKGQGTVNRVDANAGKINLTHGPIPSLKWPGMTMDFAVKDKQGLAKLKAGQKVEFKVAEQSKGQYAITEIAPVN
ncbi:MAG: copper-binding protein [Betaproteobacteria bacterium]|nr:copper-binding protein [Betaproteobacteria bacterium]